MSKMTASMLASCTEGKEQGWERPFLSHRPNTTLQCAPFNMHRAAQCQEDCNFTEQTEQADRHFVCFSKTNSASVHLLNVPLSLQTN